MLMSPTQSVPMKETQVCVIGEPLLARVVGRLYGVGSSSLSQMKILDLRQPVTRSDPGSWHETESWRKTSHIIIIIGLRSLF